MCASLHGYNSCVLACIFLGSSSFSYEDDSRPARGTKAAIPPPMYEDTDRPRSPPGPTSSFLANMGWVGHTHTQTGREFILLYSDLN